MNRTALLLGLIVSSGLAGCLGSVEPARIPQQSLQENGWSQTKSTSDNLVWGLGDLEIRDYEPESGFAGATVATVNDVPLVDEEERLLPRAIERIEERRDVNLSKIGTERITLVNVGSTIEATEYEVQGAPGPARALVFTPTCAPFVAVASYGLQTSGDGGVFGSDEERTPYQEAKDIGRHVAC